MSTVFIESALSTTRPYATEPSFPRKWESRILGFQSFPIDSRRVRGPDSRLRGNDEFRDCGIVGNDGFQDYGVVGNDGF
ncbi:TPA: hypothetical protein AABK69_05285 [Neisseria gonorrhoeae]|nr:hypothetical protein A6J46_09220 [Neisseria gonorrhoeae]EEZ52294.1 conserved hypothetical protein [Neisseria gonorrhoeae PID1]PNL74847.1 hypothetical protein A6J45_004605 [Neisseria gonorrhoeae]ROU58078.1 hypothetical protein EGO73_05935 [Neisseria gonorrhoeae]ROV28284.1 hypothetical protein EGP34_05730 [Neisseria gonorrhoeae]